MNKPSTARWL